MKLVYSSKRLPGFTLVLNFKKKLYFNMFIKSSNAITLIKIKVQKYLESAKSLVSPIFFLYSVKRLSIKFKLFLNNIIIFI